MPVYNAAPYLREAIEGVLNQTYSEVELIICDNCSTDKSPEIAQEYARKYSNIHFIQNNWNIGFNGNAHKATSNCHGDFILMHAADDYLLPDAFESYVNIIQTSGTEPKNLVLMSDFLRGDANGNAKDRLTLSSDNQTLLSFPFLKEVQDTGLSQIHGNDLLKFIFPKLISFGGVGSVLVSRNLYEKTEGYLSNHTFNPDKHFLYKVLSLSPEIFWLRKPLYYYRIHESNQLGQQKSSAILRQLMDEYAYTFEYPNEFYQEFGDGKAAIINQFLNYDCINSSLREIANGNSKQGFRNLCFGLSTYPDQTLRNSKTYLALMGLIMGPLGNWIFGLIYKSGYWKKMLRTGHGGK